MIDEVDVLINLNKKLNLCKKSCLNRSDFTEILLRYLSQLVLNFHQPYN